MMTTIITTQIILTQIIITKTIKEDEMLLLIFSVKEVIWIHLEYEFNSWPPILILYIFKYSNKEGAFMQNELIMKLFWCKFFYLSYERVGCKNKGIS